MRSDIDLSSVGTFGLVRVVVRGVGRKLGVTRDLTPEERAAIDRAISGYLADPEDSYQARLRDDYPIFPAGRLRYDNPPSRWPRTSRGESGSSRRATLTVSNQPIGKIALTDLFHALERIAGGEPVPGRGRYGIRREAADVYEDYETDERVLTTRPAIAAQTPGARSTRRSIGKRCERGRRQPAGAYAQPHSADHLSRCPQSDTGSPIEDSEVAAENDPDARPKGSKTDST